MIQDSVGTPICGMHQSCKWKAGWRPRRGAPSQITTEKQDWLISHDRIPFLTTRTCAHLKRLLNYNLE
ncbi:hypothetical protein J6590_038949 [Homalodisca vitripennis]|nr:hypothetical protein J6590_038949 [Homalodisca vitripennis]